MFAPLDSRPSINVYTFLINHLLLNEKHFSVSDVHNSSSTKLYWPITPFSVSHHIHDYLDYLQK